MNRLTDNDKTWGPFTLAKWKRTFTVEFSTGDEEDGPMVNQLLFVVFGWALRIALPNLIPCARQKVQANWDTATVARLGRDHYFNTWDRRFGFSLSDMGTIGGNGYDFLQIKYGRQTHDSDTDQSWCCHLPWKQWDHVRYSLYEPDGAHFYTEPYWKERRGKDRDFHDYKADCPASYFEFEDYDRERVVATCHIDEREWHKGTGWFTWLKYFHKPMIRRSLYLWFNKEVGPEKGSWKGGIIGTGTDMLPGDTPESAFRRFCEKEHERKGRKYHLKFIGPCAAPPKKQDTVEGAIKG